MKLKNSEISFYTQNLQNISTKVSGKLAYIIARNLRKLVDEIKEYEQIKNDLIVKHGTVNDDGVSFININTPEYKDFLKEINEYANIEQEVNLLKINPEDLYSSTLTAQEILSIDFMIEETVE